jgi:cytochrome c-type biogenesis protein CcmH/NrfF
VWFLPAVALGVAAVALAAVTRRATAVSAATAELADDVGVRRRAVATAAELADDVDRRAGPGPRGDRR